MNVAYEWNQTSGYDWRRSTDARQYHRQQSVDAGMPQIQLSELADLEAQMGRYEGEHRNLIEKIKSVYVLEDEVAVWEFLNTHRRLAPVLVLAEPHLRRCFGDAVLSLRSNSDEHGWEMLYTFVQWPGSPEQAMQALDAFDDEWWLANSYPAGSNLTFTYRLT